MASGTIKSYEIKSKLKKLILLASYFKLHSQTWRSLGDQLANSFHEAKLFNLQPAGNWLQEFAGTH